MKTWPSVTLGEICDLKYGKSLSAANRVSGKFEVYGSNGVVGTHTSAITEGPTIVVGRKGSFGEINFSPMACWPIDTTYYVDETATSVDLSWLAHLLPTLRLTELNRAAAIPGLNREDAYRQTLLLPPIEEQRRIAAILVQADALRTKRREVCALHGKLQRSAFHELTATSVVATKPLAALGVTITSGKNLIGTADDTHSKNRVIKVSAVSRGGFDDSKSKPLPAAYSPPQSHRVRNGDLLFARANGSIDLLGAVALVEGDFTNLYLPDKVWRIEAPAPVSNAFLLGVFRSESFRAFIRHNASGAAGVKNIGQQTVLAFPAPVLSAHAHNEFARQVRLMRIQEEALMESLSILERLYSSLEALAFSGQL